MCGDGELYRGNSWSRACGSSNDFLNLGGGESEPRTELKMDMFEHGEVLSVERCNLYMFYCLLHLFM
jgi:hypothetical protein